MSTLCKTYKICGYILSTNNYNFIALRCIDCDMIFKHWSYFYRHIKENHGKTTQMKNDTCTTTNINSNVQDFDNNQVETETTSYQADEQFNYYTTIMDNEEFDNAIEEETTIELVNDETAGTQMVTNGTDGTAQLPLLFKNINMEGTFSNSVDNEEIESDIEETSTELVNDKTAGTQMVTTYTIDSTQLPFFIKSIKTGSTIAYSEDNEETDDDSEEMNTMLMNDYQPTRTQMLCMKEHEEEYKEIAQELVEQLKIKRMLWDYTHRDYRKPHIRMQALAEIKSNLIQKGLAVDDRKLRHTIQWILCKFRQTEQTLLVHGKLSTQSESFLQNYHFLSSQTQDSICITQPDESNAVLNEIVEEVANNFINSLKDDSINEIAIICKNNQNFQYIRFHLSDNKMAKDFLKLLNKNTYMWSAMGIEEENRLLANWIPMFQERHNITFSCRELRLNMKLLRRYYETLLDRRDLNASERQIRDQCEQLSMQQTRISCNYCESFFRTQNNYKAHLYRVHQLGENPFECEDCGQCFLSAPKLSLHIKTMHRAELNFTCTMCGRRYVTRHDLNVHLLQHTGELNYICATCGKRFRRKINLSYHETHAHQRQRNFSCHFCTKAFYTNAMLREHVSTHLNIRNKKCSICGQSFQSCHALMRHKQTHAIVKRYVCTLCDTRFSQRVGLKAHLKLKHKLVAPKCETVRNETGIEPQANDESDSNCNWDEQEMVEEYLIDID